MSSNYGDMGGWEERLTNFGEENAAFGGPVMDPQQTTAYAARDMSLGAETGKAKVLATQQPIEQATQRVDSDGNNVYDFKGLSQAAYEQLQELIQAGRQSKAETAELTSRLRAKRDVMEAHPAIAQIGRIAAAAANAYIAPGSRGAALVHGAGAVAGEYFKDTPESLSADISDAQRRQVATQAPITAMAIAEQRTEQQIQHQLQREARLDAAEDRRVERDRRLTIASGLGNIYSTAANGTQWPGDAVRKQALLLGASPEEAEGAVLQTKAAYAGWLEKKNTENKLNLEQQKELYGLQAEKQLYIATRLQEMKNEADMTNSAALGSITRMEGILKEHGELVNSKNKGLQDIDYWARAFRAAGVPGFEGTNTNPQDAVNRMKSLLAKGTYRDQNDKEHEVLEVLKTVNPEADSKYMAQIRREVENGWGAMQHYRQRAPELIKQYDNRRSTLPPKFQDGIAELKPGGYIPLAGPSQPAPPKSAREQAMALATAQPGVVPPTAGRGNPQSVPRTAAPGQQVATPTPGVPAPSPGGLAPPNKAFPNDMGPAPEGLQDGKYTLGGKTIMVVNGRRWGQ